MDIIGRTSPPSHWALSIPSIQLGLGPLDTFNTTRTGPYGYHRSMVASLPLGPSIPSTQLGPGPLDIIGRWSPRCRLARPIPSIHLGPGPMDTIGRRSPPSHRALSIPSMIGPTCLGPCPHYRRTQTLAAIGPVDPLGHNQPHQQWALLTRSAKSDQTCNGPCRCYRTTPSMFISGPIVFYGCIFYSGPVDSLNP